MVQVYLGEFDYLFRARGAPWPLAVDSAAPTTAGEESAIGRSARAWPQIPPIPSINRLLS